MLTSTWMIKEDNSHGNSEMILGTLGGQKTENLPNLGKKITSQLIGIDKALLSTLVGPL